MGAESEWERTCAMYVASFSIWGFDLGIKPKDLT